MAKKEKEINVVRIDVTGPPKIVRMEHKLENFQYVVGGLIEVVPFTKDILCIINEEGKLLGLPPNFAYELNFDTETYIDVIFGNCFFVGDDGDDFRTLTKEEIYEVFHIVGNGKALMIDLILGTQEAKHDETD